MCGLAGAYNLGQRPISNLQPALAVMNELQRHRGPDGSGLWHHPQLHIGLAHRRLSIIDLAGGGQPMADAAGNQLVFNGEIYNYLELRDEIGPRTFRTQSDTEVILHAYRKWGERCVEKLRGMFAFALWDEQRQRLVCARDRFGIKPFYYCQAGDVLYFASEVKALLPFLPRIETDLAGLRDYLTFQLCLDGKTLFQGVHELQPGHLLLATGRVQVRRYWQVYYNLDFHHTEKYFAARLTELLQESVDLHKRSDVPIGAYLSGGLDSSIVACVAAREAAQTFEGFTGKFSLGPRYDESRYAREVARHAGFRLHEIDITPQDFINNLEKVIYHLDYPVAGPGSFPQYMVSRLAGAHRKVVLGGQGGDEIFGGYARYLIAYFEQCIKGAIDGTMHNGNFVVTYESIIPNLVALQGYKPLLQEFWREGLFEDLDRRYFRLINRAPSLGDEVAWDRLDNGYLEFEAFQKIFLADNVGKESYFDKMTHFDFKTLLPALLHVEDRVSMAHGVESRVPFLDHPLVEFAATIPSDVKFKNGTMKHLLRNALAPVLPPAVLERKDKMGFPVPLTEWIRGEASDYVRDILSTRKALTREVIDNRRVLTAIDKETQFGRKIWGLLSLEIWQQKFHDCEYQFKQLMAANEPHQRLVA
jgi:asparagine synthase (glutamine-hydrolysing)